MWLQIFMRKTRWSNNKLYAFLTHLRLCVFLFLLFHICIVFSSYRLCISTSLSIVSYFLVKIYFYLQDLLCQNCQQIKRQYGPVSSSRESPNVRVCGKNTKVIIYITESFLSTFYLYEKEHQVDSNTLTATR